MIDQKFESSEYTWPYENLCRAKGITDPYEKIENLIRVLKTRKAYGNKTGIDENTLYGMMCDATSGMARFKGDASLFSQIYCVFSDFETIPVLAFARNIFSAERGLFFCPDALVAKFNDYISDSVKTVFIPESEQYGESLKSIIVEHPQVQFKLGVLNPQWLEILRYEYAEQQNAEVDLANIYQDGFTNQRYDLILSVPVFGARSIAEGQDFICKDSDMIALQNLLYHIDVLDGRLVIVLPAKITFGGGSISALREYVKENYKIDEISLLPSGLFLPSTAIRTYLLAFSNGTTEEVLVRKYESSKPIRRDEPCEELIKVGEEILFPDEFADLNGWNVDIAFEENDEDIQRYLRSVTKKVRLADVATIFRGKAVNAKTESGNIGVINISNLTDGGIDYKNLELLAEEERKVARYALEEGDVLVTSRGTTIKVAVFEKQAMTCIPSANFNVIRPNGMIRGAYLKLFLESPVGNKLLKGLQRGTSVMNLNFKDLYDLEVPALTLTEQDALISEYSEGFSFYKQTIAAAEEAWAGIQKEIQSKLF